MSHFINVESRIGDKWLDFEEEIESFFRIIHEEKYEFNEGVSFFSRIDAVNESDQINKRSYKDLLVSLKDEFDGLVRAMSIYFAGYVNEIAVEQKVELIDRCNYFGVLSFNYTNTYAERYKPELGCCYLHGKAELGKSKGNKMVLGFDDHYSPESKLVHELIPYEKFYQRLLNCTDNEYLDWLDQMKSEENNTVSIFGHSLTPADGDVIRQFILCKNTKTMIYYLDDNDKYEKLRNITIILGADDTIRLVGGREPMIKFIKL